jgi:hypothetical protein
MLKGGTHLAFFDINYTLKGKVMCTCAKHQSNHWWLALLLPVLVGFCLFLPSAHADGQKGVPTKQAPAPKAGPVKKKPSPSKANTSREDGVSTSCRWVEMAVPEADKADDAQRIILVPGQTVDLLCGPTIALPGYLATVPATSSRIEVGGKSFVCGPF